jgi:hypothetical protein
MFGVKKLIPSLIAATLIVATGCATLLNRGVVEPADIIAACTDVNALCANPVARTNPNVAAFCDIVGPACASVPAPSTTSTTLPSV